MGFLKIATICVTDISCVVLSNFVNNTCQIEVIFVKSKFHHNPGMKAPIANYINKCWPSFNKVLEFFNSSLGTVQTYLLLFLLLPLNYFFVVVIIIVIFVPLSNFLFMMKIVLMKPSLIIIRRFC